MSTEINDLILNNEMLIQKICRTYYRNLHDQEDLFQEIIIRILNSYDGFRKESKFSTWLYRVSINTAISHKNQKQLPLLTPQHIADKSIDDVYYAQKGESDIDYLYKAIEKLNKIEKAIIHLYLEEKSYAEISEIIGISEKNVSVRIVRIKKKLRGLYLSVYNQ